MEGCRFRASLCLGDDLGLDCRDRIVDDAIVEVRGQLGEAGRQQGRRREGPLCPVFCIRVGQLAADRLELTGERFDEVPVHQTADIVPVDVELAFIVVEHQVDEGARCAGAEPGIGDPEFLQAIELPAVDADGVAEDEGAHGAGRALIAFRDQAGQLDRRYRRAEQLAGEALDLLGDFDDRLGAFRLHPHGEDVDEGAHDIAGAAEVLLPVEDRHVDDQVALVGPEIDQLEPHGQEQGVQRHLVAPGQRHQACHVFGRQFVEDGVEPDVLDRRRVALERQQRLRRQVLKQGELIGHRLLVASGALPDLLDKHVVAELKR